MPAGGSFPCAGGLCSAGRIGRVLPGATLWGSDDRVARIMFSQTRAAAGPALKGTAGATGQLVPARGVEHWERGPENAKAPIPQEKIGRCCRLNGGFRRSATPSITSLEGGMSSD